MRSFKKTTVGARVDVGKGRSNLGMRKAAKLLEPIDIFVYIKGGEEGRKHKGICKMRKSKENSRGRTEG